MGLLEQLAEELGIQSEGLRETLLSSGDETLSPSYLTTDTQGRVSAQFTGHISASGLELQAATNNLPGAVNKVEWIRTSDGAVIADVEAYFDPIGGRGLPPQQNVLLRCIGDGTLPPKTTIQAETDSGTTLEAVAKLIVSAQNIAGGQSVVAQAGGNTAKVIDDNGTSDLLIAPDPSGANISQPARALNTNYQPDTQHATLVVIAVTGRGSGLVDGVNVLIDTLAPPTIHLGYLQMSASNDWMMSTFLVPRGWWYRIAVANGAPTLGQVTEYYL